MRSLRHSLALLPAPRRLAMIVSMFVATVACLLFLVDAQLAIMSGVRAYVGGEGLWSKGQKDAVYHLQRYATSRDARDFAQYVDAIAAPLGDRRARLELLRPRPDVDAVRDGFTAGRNHADDIPMMGWLFRRFGSVSYMSEAIAIWGAADREIERLTRLGEALHAAVEADPPSPRRVRQLLAKVEAVNARVTPLENAFSATLGEAARALKRWLMEATVAASALLLGIAVMLSAMIIRGSRAAADAVATEARIAASLARVGRELISTLDTPELLARLCALATEVLDGAAGQTLVWRPEQEAFVAVAGVGVAQGERLLDPADVRSPATMSALFAARGDDAVTEVRPGVWCLALRRRETLVGVQVVAGSRGDGAAAAHRRIAEGVAYLASMAWSHANMVAELEEANRLKSEFVSTMSHELRTPLNVILGYAEMARELDDTAERNARLLRLEASGRDLLGLIETTLEIGRIDAGRDVVKLETVDLRDFLETVGAACGRLSRRDGVDFVWPEVPACRVRTDPRKLTVVLRNLVGNALKFTETGAVRVDVTLSPETLRLRVADTGIGIGPQDQQTVFEMFRQADGSDNRRFGGSGLGLYIVRRFVEQLGGEVTLESALGCGAAFTVTLPRLDPPAELLRAA